MFAALSVVLFVGALPAVVGFTVLLGRILGRHEEKRSARELL